MKNILGFIRIDMERAFSTKFLFGCFGVFSVMIWSSLGSTGKILDNTVIFLLWWCAYSIRFILVMFFCSTPYAGCFCEDIENGYVRQLLVRGNLRTYCISKVLCILVSAIMTMVVGIAMFVLGIKFFIPWMELDNSVYQTAIRSGSFHTVIQKGHYFLYSLLYSFQIGLLAAILALVSACVSLFISNKLLVWSIPMLSYYLITQYSWALFSGIKTADLDSIFSGRYNIFNNDIVSFLYAFGVTIVISMFLSYIIIRRLKRRICCE